MRSNLFIIIFLTFSSAINLELSKQNLPIEDSRIAWGTNVESINEYPFTVAIGGYDEWGFAEVLCTASLIDQEWIVTAAHCVEQIQNYNFGFAVLGTVRLYGNQEATFTQSTVLEMFVHPLYNAPTADNDIALLRIEPVEFNEGIQPILLSSTIPENQTQLKVTGYGYTETGGFGRLKEADMALLIDEDWPAESNVIYALGSTVNGYNQEPCPGDSGGPLFKVSRSCNNCVVDFTPYGSECCDTAWDEFGLTCAQLEENYFWECGGCNCPGDLSCEEQGLITCEFESEDGTGCAIDLDQCLEYGQCPDGQIFDCDGEGCWPQFWLGDGYCDDGSVNNVDLSCYDNDGGDCDRLLSSNDRTKLISSNTRIRSINTSNNNSRNENEFELVGVTSFATSGCEDGWGPSGFQNIYYHLDWINLTSGILSQAGDVIQDGEVNVLDVVALVDYILFGSNLTIEQLANGDFTQDGNVNVLDIVAIVEIILE